MALAQIMYRLTWSWADNPEREFRALVNHDASMDLSRVLEGAGAIVDRSPASVATRPPAGPQTAAHGRALPRDTGRAASYPEDPPAYRPRRAGDPRPWLHADGHRSATTPEDASSGNGTEFS